MYFKKSRIRMKLSLKINEKSMKTEKVCKRRRTIEGHNQGKKERKKERKRKINKEA